ncbi:MAG: SLBB domain-containing protein, partial [Pseudomonadota bacterium]|nr:SLBB domain-containing protein [Pseudomonadota bacterium]
GEYTETGKGSLPVINAGDAIFIPEKLDVNEKSWLRVSPQRAVKMIGAINRPGRYEWDDSMSLLDLIAHAGGPDVSADISKVQILKGEDPSSPMISFDLETFLGGRSGMELPNIEGGDTVMVPELPRDPTDNKAMWTRQSSERSIYVMGAVGAPGRYAFTYDLHFLDILTAADGPTVSADLRNIRIMHRSCCNGQVSHVDLARYFETGDESLLPAVYNEDVIYVPNINRNWLEVKKESTVRVLGAVRLPGRYEYSDQMTLLDVLAEAGGPATTALQDRIVVVNLSSGKGGEDARIFDLVKFAKTGDFDKLPVLRAGDTVYVPDSTVSNWNIFMRYVRDIATIATLAAITGAI